MSIDLSQFQQVFFEESFEGLDAMEAQLLELELDNIDPEAINTIFRAAHSIKGGSATFNLTNIAEFTHHLETLLDEMREGKRPMTEDAVNLFLRSVDCLRSMIAAHQENEPYDPAEAETITAEFLSMLDKAPAQTDEVEESSSADVERAQGWKIRFVPDTGIVASGNEPYRIFRELADLGELSVTAYADKLPSWDALEADECYLYWDIILTGDIDKDDIEEAFSWVLDECELNIVELYTGDQDVSVVQDTSVAQDTPAIQNAPIGQGQDTSTSHDPSSEQDASSEQYRSVTGSEQVQQDDDDTVIEKHSQAPAQSVSSQKAQPTQPTKSSPAKSVSAGASIRVSIDKLDSLINLVGELVITQSMLSELGNNFDMTRVDSLQNGLLQLLQNTKQLQESVMQIRMLPISFAFNRFPRMTRDLAKALGKSIELEIFGEQTELDKTVLEQITDPLVHLVRNSIDHGIERPDVRQSKGKAPHGTVTLKAYHQGGNIVIEIADDGAGLNRARILEKAKSKNLLHLPEEDMTDGQIFNLIFEPGFSTAEAVTDVSGRGVGMDVVRKNITNLGGTIEVESEQDLGSTFRIRLPLTLAILDGQLVKVADQTYIIPLVSIVESLQIKNDHVNHVSGAMELYRLRDENIPIIRLYREFGVEQHITSLDESLLVVVEAGSERVGLLVDDLLAQQQVVIKSLETNYRKVEGVSGATILGDGKVALILDVAGLIKRIARGYRIAARSKVA